MRRRVGLILVGLGAVLVVIGASGLLLAGNRSPTVQAASSDTEAHPTSTSATAPTGPSGPQPTETQDGSTTTTIVASPTTPVTMTTTAPTTTTTAPTTTTTVAPTAAVADFITEFGAAIAAEDTDWLYQHLHSSIVLGYGEDLCRSFITREILALREYTLTGTVTGPVTKTLTTGVGDVRVENIYEAETSFVFQGSPFDAKADFVVEDAVSWLTACR